MAASWAWVRPLRRTALSAQVPGGGSSEGGDGLISMRCRSNASCSLAMAPGGPSLPLLSNRRVTQGMLEDGAVRVIDDDWRYEGNSA
eukprot:11055501-Alexandrium_andersonii.AAC.1